MGEESLKKGCLAHIVHPRYKIDALQTFDVQFLEMSKIAYREGLIHRGFP